MLQRKRQHPRSEPNREPDSQICVAWQFAATDAMEPKRRVRIFRPAAWQIIFMIGRMIEPASVATGIALSGAPVRMPPNFIPLLK